MKLIDKAALVAEIERRISVLKANESVISMLTGGMFVNEFKDLLSFLDTLEVKEVGVDFGDPQGDIGVKWVQEEPVSNNLKEAAHLYVDTTIEYFDSEGNPCCYSAFIAGAQWQKERLIEKACEWLKENKDHPFIECEDPCLSGYLTDEFIEDFKKAMEE